jgi:hypothetical protein
VILGIVNLTTLSGSRWTLPFSDVVLPIQDPTTLSYRSAIGSPSYWAPTAFARLYAVPYDDLAAGFCTGA